MTAFAIALMAAALGALVATHFHARGRAQRGENAMSSDQQHRAKALQNAVSAINTQFGDGSIFRLGARPIQRGPVLSTGCLGLDLALGVGGLPAGRMVEIYGPESSGKTTLTLEIIAELQRNGGIAAFVDAEHALDLSYAKALGVQVDDLLFAQPDCGEQALEITDTLVRSSAVQLVVVDSVAALTPRAEIEGDMGDNHMGLHARLMSQALRKITSGAGQTGTTVIFINQLRHKIGVTFGSPETTTGGNALKFYASMRIDIRRIAAIKKAEKVVGNRTRVRVKKNKLAPPLREVEFDIMYGTGINRDGDLLDRATELGLVNKSGAWYSHGDNRLGQGRDKAADALAADPALWHRLREAVITASNPPPPPRKAVPVLAPAPEAPPAKAPPTRVAKRKQVTAKAA